MSRIWTIAWIGILVGTLAMPVGAAANHPLALADHGFTLKVRFTWNDSHPGGQQGMWLTGASTTPDGRPSFLGLAWSPVRDGWFGDVWGLQLVSDAGLFPSGLRATASNSGLIAGTDYVSLAVIKPVSGHQYEAIMGYSPATGYTGIEVTDLTAGRLIVRESYELLPSCVPLFSGRGIERDLDVVANTALPGLEIIEANLPLGLEWLVTQPVGEETGFRPIVSLNRQFPGEFHLRLPWSRLSGELAVFLEDESFRYQLLDITNPQDLTEYTVALTDVPPGIYDLVTHYTEGGATWEVARTELTVGQIALGLAEVQLTEGTNGAVHVSGAVTIDTDAKMTLPEVGVRIDLKRHDFHLPNLVGSGHITTTTVWEQEAMQPVQSDVTTMPFSLPVPVPLDTEEAVWQLAVQPRIRPDTLLSEASVTDVWVGKTKKAFSWDGLLDLDSDHHMTIVPGVDLYRATGHIAAGPIDMFVLEVDLSHPGIHLEAMAGDRFLGPEERWPRARISDMVMRDGAVAGVNGSFYFLDTMLPRSMLLRDWHVLRSPGPPENGILGITDDGKAYIGLWEWKGAIKNDAGKTVPVAGINPRTHGRHGIVLYRSPWRMSPGNVSPDIDPLVDQVVELVVADLVQIGPGHMSGRIVDMLDGKPGIQLKQSMAVISGRGDGAALLRESFAIGQTIEIEYTLPAAQDWPGLPAVDTLSTAVSGGVILVKNGVYGGAHVTADTGRHPRAAVGVSRDRQKLYFLVADGRSPRSVGLTYKELADFFLHIGAFEALNLDSGGSSTLSIRPHGTDPARAVNSPSDGGERFVADGIGIFYNPNR